MTVPKIMMPRSSGTDIESTFFSASMPHTAISTITIPQKIDETVTGIPIPKASCINVEKASPHTLTCRPKNPIKEIVNKELTRSLVPFLPNVDCAIAQVGIPKSAPCIPKINVSNNTIR